MAQNFDSSGGAPGQPFFLGAPITKVVGLSVAIAYVLIQVKKAHNALSMDMEKIIYNGQYYRLVTGHITFSSGGELIMGTGVLCVLMRRFEREMSSRKLATFLLFASLITVMLEVLVQPPTFSGPYPWIGALLLLYHLYTPSVHPRFFGLLGFHFSEKAILYSFCFQVIFYGWISTIAPSVIGIFAGYLCSSTPLANLELPDAVCGFVQAMGERFADDPPPVYAAAQPNNRGFMPRQAAPRPQPQPQPPQPPPESLVEQLTNMGFERDAVVRALRQTNNNVERAADRLLMGG